MIFTAKTQLCLLVQSPPILFQASTYPFNFSSSVLPFCPVHQSWSQTRNMLSYIPTPLNSPPLLLFTVVWSHWLAASSADQSHPWFQLSIIALAQSALPDLCVTIITCCCNLSSEGESFSFRLSLQHLFVAAITNLSVYMRIIYPSKKL